MNTNGDYHQRLSQTGRMKSYLVTQKLILDALRSSKEDMTIQEIAKKSKIHRLTCAKYLAILEVKGYVRHRTIGRAKLFSPGPRLKSGKYTLKDIKEFT